MAFLKTTAPQLHAPVGAAEPPPPISGGTLLVLRDQKTVVVADADRDQIFIVDADAASLRGTVNLDHHDEPGRLVEDGAGLVHVGLRRSGKLVTIDPAKGSLVASRSICAAPRGVAYDAVRDRLHIACAEGRLITMAPTATSPERTLTLPIDLRDVVVDGDTLLVSRLRAADVLVLDAAAGTIKQTIRLPAFSHPALSEGDTFEPSVAWRMRGRAGGGGMMVHQRAKKGRIKPMPGGYGNGDPCSAIVQTAVTVVKPGEAPVAGPAIPAMVLPVDVALSPSGTRVALISAALAHADPTASSALFVTHIDDVAQEWKDGCGFDGKHGPTPFPSCQPTAEDPALCNGSMSVSGSVVAVGFLDEARVVVQKRQPAELLIVPLDAAATTSYKTVTLAYTSREDSGHAVIHANSSTGIACASCHPEGHEDSRAWDFECDGVRRTQDMSGGLSGTEPFHWDGRMTDFETLAREVFFGRMGGPELNADFVELTLRWLDSIPARQPLRPASDPQVERGRLLFNDATVACATCHGGARLSNNMSVPVGTATFPLQVPSLRGIGWRAPFMHTGCAATLTDRFKDPACGGGEMHGRTAHLTESQLADLVAYMESL